MACSVIRRTDGTIYEVLAPNGKPSHLFNTIKKIPFIEGEKALDYYAVARNQIADDVVLDENGEPILVFLPMTGTSPIITSRGVVFYRNFATAYVRDRDRGGVRMGLLKAKTAEVSEVPWNPSKPQMDALHSENVENTTSDLVVVPDMYMVGMEGSEFVELGSLNRGGETVSYEGFIEKMMSKNLVDLERNTLPLPDRPPNSTLFTREPGVYAVRGGDSIQLDTLVDMSHPTYKALYLHYMDKGSGWVEIVNDPTYNALAWHHRGTGAITLNLGHPNFHHLMDQNLLDRVMAHETIHFAINESLKGRPNERRAFEAELSNLRDWLIAKAPNNLDPELNRTLDIIHQSTVEEMVTYALTDPKVATLMDSILMETSRSTLQTIWTRIKEVIMGVLKNSSPTILDSVVNTLNTYVGDFREDADVYKPNPTAEQLARKYMEQNNLTYPVLNPVKAVAYTRLNKIAREYGRATHEPNNPRVREAYEALARETIEQYKMLIEDDGIRRWLAVDMYDGQGEPYASFQEMADDVNQFAHLYILSTEKELGDLTDQQRAENPMFRDSGFVDVNGEPMLVNDLFKAVHTYFGHVRHGNNFGALGAENAWLSHSHMYSPTARKAMTAETRGRNSYINFIDPLKVTGVGQKMTLLSLEAEQRYYYDERPKVPGTIFDQFVDQIRQIGTVRKVVDASEVALESLLNFNESDTTTKYDGMFSTETTGMPGYDEILNPAYHLKKGYHYFHKGVEATIEFMSPQEYLRRVQEGFAKQRRGGKLRRRFDPGTPEGISEEKRARIREAVEAGNKLDMPTLDYSVYFSQEGRNRATVAIDRGEALIPVAIFREVTKEEQKERADQIAEQLIRQSDGTFEGAYQAMKKAGIEYAGEILIREAIEEKLQIDRIEEISPEERENLENIQINIISILKGEHFQRRSKRQVADFLNSLAEVIVPPGSEAKDMIKRFLENVYGEVAHFMTIKEGARPAGMTWYKEDMQEFEKKIKILFPELSESDEVYKLFLSMVAITSSGQNPNTNLLFAYNMYTHSLDPANGDISSDWGESRLTFVVDDGTKNGKSITGSIVKEHKTTYHVELINARGDVMKDRKGKAKKAIIQKSKLKEGYPKPTGYTNRGEVVAGHVEKIQKLFADLGSLEKVIEWLETPHPIAELRNYNINVPDVNGGTWGKTNSKYDPTKNAEGERNGAFIFGEKIGAFYQNLIGIDEEVTMDLWWSRTWNRYMGTMIGASKGKEFIEETPRSEEERAVMRQAVSRVAEDLDLDVSELQAVMWYMEQEIWQNLGNNSPSLSYVDAVNTLSEKLNIDENTRQRFEEATADLSEAEKRRQNALERASTILDAKDRGAVVEQSPVGLSNVIVNLSIKENKTGQTQGFFSDVVEGISDKFKPHTPWSPMLPLTDSQKAFLEAYEVFIGNFDAHISTSIPTFRDTQIKVGQAIVDTYAEDYQPLMYDIGGSEGSFVKTITQQSGGNIQTINLDVNENMQNAHESNPVEGSQFVREAFGMDYVDEETGKVTPRHVPEKKADIVHESMTFQFITPEREDFIRELKTNYLANDGILLLEEKLTPTNEEVWRDNEAKKEEYKLQHYSREQLDKKSEEVLTGMKKNQTNLEEFELLLRRNFEYVHQYWDAGNFRGFIATNNYTKYRQFLNNIGYQIDSQYSSDVTIEEAYRLNGDKPMDLAPNGKPSKLFESILGLPEINGNREKATAFKAQLYSPRFTSWFGRWMPLTGQEREDILMEIEWLRQELEVVKNNQGYDMISGWIEQLEMMLEDTPTRYALGKPINSSLAIDENGEPLLLYHGTPTGNFNEFDPEKIGGKGSGLRERAIWFTNSLKVAERYTERPYGVEQDEYHPKIFATFLNIRSVAEYDNMGRFSEELTYPDQHGKRRGYKTIEESHVEGIRGFDKVDAMVVRDTIEFTPPVIGKSAMVEWRRKLRHLSGDSFAFFPSNSDTSNINIINKGNALAFGVSEVVKLNQALGATRVGDADMFQITNNNSRVVFKEFKNPITGDTSGVEIDLVETSIQARGEGSARELLNQFIAEADKLGLDIHLSVVPRPDEKRYALDDAGRSQKILIVPSNSENYANLTEDGKGNFVFYHRGAKGYRRVEPGKPSATRASLAEESAKSAVGGLAFYYTTEQDAESMVSGEAHYMVKVPMEKVYDFNADPLNFVEMARKQHERSGHSGAFDFNMQLAHVTRIANDEGFDMVVSVWDGRTRAQTTKSLYTSDVQETKGNVVTKLFRESFVSNRDKGWKPVPAVPPTTQLESVYEKIADLFDNPDGWGNPLYQLREQTMYNFDDPYAPFNSQTEITELIESSKIPKRLKDNYFEALSTKGTSGHSVHPKMHTKFSDPKKGKGLVQFYTSLGFKFKEERGVASEFEMIRYPQIPPPQTNVSDIIDYYLGTGEITRSCKI